KNNAQGARGGLAGGAVKQQKETNGQLKALPACGVITMQAGERFVIRTNGGGGYGAPLERKRDLVEHDLREGWISEVQARDTYGWTGDIPYRNTHAVCSYSMAEESSDGS
ncbi:MAG: hydantoinase B/oxoprolinase family protein, partial [Pseudomonadota bacterium]